MDFTVVALYKFTKLVDPESVKEKVDVICSTYQILGALIMAHEGINGTVSGPTKNIPAFLVALREIIPIEEHELKISTAEINPFYRMRTMVKPEIITMGCEDVDPEEKRGTYVDSKQWNQLLEDPNLLLIGNLTIFCSYIYKMSTHIHFTPDVRRYTEYI